MKGALIVTPGSLFHNKFQGLFQGLFQYNCRTFAGLSQDYSRTNPGLSQDYFQNYSKTISRTIPGQFAGQFAGLSLSTHIVFTSISDVFKGKCDAFTYIFDVF